MATTTLSLSTLRWHSVIGAVCFLAGVAFGALSVYSNSRALCALWVAVALVFALTSGLVIGATRRSSTRNESR